MCELYRLKQHLGKYRAYVNNSSGLPPEYVRFIRGTRNLFGCWCPRENGRAIRSNLEQSCYSSICTQIHVSANKLLVAIKDYPLIYVKEVLWHTTRHLPEVTAALFVYCKQQIATCYPILPQICSCIGEVCDITVKCYTYAFNCNGTEILDGCKVLPDRG